MDPSTLKASIFGMFDGLTSLLGVLIPLLAFSHLLIFSTCMGLAVSSAISMGLGEYLSSDKDLPRIGRIRSSLYMGVFTGIGCGLPAIPFAFFSGAVALILAGILYLLATLIVAWMKVSDMGWRSALITTFMVSFVAVGLVFGATLLLPVPVG